MLLVGCGGSSPVDEPPPAVAPVAVACEEPQPLPPPEWDHEVSDRACVECHDDVATDWAGSRHQQAFVNEDFQRSYERETLDFCRDCHAPRRQVVGDAEAEFFQVNLVGKGCDPLQMLGL